MILKIEKIKKKERVKGKKNRGTKNKKGNGRKIVRASNPDKRENKK